MVPFSSFASVNWEQGPSQVVGYNGYPSIRIAGQDLASASESTRRALRGLAAAGRVACLGYARGGQRWGLPEDVAARRATWAEVWPPESQARVSAVMGERYARSVRRFLVAAL